MLYRYVYVTLKQTSFMLKSLNFQKKSSYFSKLQINLCNIHTHIISVILISVNRKKNILKKIFPRLVIYCTHFKIKIYNLVYR